MAGSLKEFY